MSKLHIDEQIPSEPIPFIWRYIFGGQMVFKVVAEKYKGSGCRADVTRSATKYYTKLQLKVVLYGRGIFE
jgi:hypothetical protein